jgi:hypothetical protein
MPKQDGVFKDENNMENTQNRNSGMRQGQNNRRPRGRHHGGSHGGHGGGHDRSNGNGGGGNPNAGNNRPRSAASLRHQTFDSNCIDVRVRGNAWQVHEKYQALARDAQSSGDRVAAEHYLQHAEHYYRIIEAINEATAAEQPRNAQPQVPFGQQPEVPANYYGTDGGLAQPANAPSPNAAADGQTPAQPQVQGEAQVERPAIPAPFFPPEDTDDLQPQPMAVRR